MRHPLNHAQRRSVGREVADRLPVSIRVMVADDNSDVCEVLRALIDAEPDMQCVGAAQSADQIIPTLRSARGEVLILDMELKGASGMDVLAECQTAVPGVPVLILSGHAGAAMARAARARGAADYLVKPGDLEALADRVRRAIGRQPGGGS